MPPPPVIKSDAKKPIKDYVSSTLEKYLEKFEERQKTNVGEIEKNCSETVSCLQDAVLSLANAIGESIKSAGKITPKGQPAVKPIAMVQPERKIRQRKEEIEQFDGESIYID